MGSDDLSFLPHPDLKPSYKTLTYSLKDGILDVALNRPKALNSFDMTLFVEIYHLFRAINYSPKDIRCVILTGAGKHFSSGLDRELSSQGDRVVAVRDCFKRQEGPRPQGLRDQAADQGDAEQLHGD